MLFDRCHDVINDESRNLLFDYLDNLGYRLVNLCVYTESGILTSHAYLRRLSTALNSVM